MNNKKIIEFYYAPQAPVEESIEFLTDVIKTRNGKEERTRLRCVPRRSVKISIPVSFEKVSELIELLYDNIDNYFEIPVWCDYRVAKKNIQKNDFFVECNPDLFLQEKYVYIGSMYTPNAKGFKVEIDYTTETGFYLKDEFISYIDTPVVYPIRIGEITSSISIETNDLNAVVSFDLQLCQEGKMEEEKPLQYKNIDLYTKDNFFYQSENFLNETIDIEKDENDFEIGIVQRNSSWIQPTVSRSFNFFADTPEEKTQIKKWLLRRSGMYREFWLPSFSNDLHIKNEDFITNFLLVENIKSINLDKKKTIGIKTNNNDWIITEIKEIQDYDGLMYKLILDAYINIYPQVVCLVSYLGINRLDSDSVTISISEGLATFSLPITEIKGGYNG